MLWETVQDVGVHYEKASSPARHLQIKVPHSST